MRKTFAHTYAGRRDLLLWEAAWLLEVTTNAARRLAREGVLRPLPATGKVIRISGSEVDRLLVSAVAKTRLRQLCRGEIVVPKPASPSAQPHSLQFPLGVAHSEPSTERYGHKRALTASSSSMKTARSGETERSLVVAGHGIPCDARSALTFAGEA